MTEFARVEGLRDSGRQREPQQRVFHKILGLCMYMTRSAGVGPADDEILLESGKVVWSG